MAFDEELSLSGKLTLEDFVQYNHYHVNKLLKGYFVLCFIVLFIIFLIPMSGDWLPILLWAGIPSLILSGLLYLYASKVRKHMAVKEYKSDQIIKHTISYTFSREGITQNVRRSHNFFEWDDFLKAQEQEDMFLLYLSKNKAIVLPKRFFLSPAQIKDFRYLVSDNVTDSKWQIS